MPDENPDIISLLKIDQDAFNHHDDIQRVMLFTSEQMIKFVNNMLNDGLLPKDKDYDLHKLEFAGFMVRTLHGSII